MSIHNVLSWPISTLLLFSQIGKPVLDKPILDMGPGVTDAVRMRLEVAHVSGVYKWTELVLI